MTSKVRGTAEAVRRIRSRKPKTVEDFAKIGVPLGHPFEGGSFRDVRRPAFRKLGFVVKFPVLDHGSTRSGIAHSNSEVRKIARLARFKALRPHLPEVFYHDKKTGIIVMRSYPDFKWKRSQDFFEKLGKLTGKLIQKLTGVEMNDIQEANIRANGRDGFVFIDLGY